MLTLVRASAAAATIRGPPEHLQTCRDVAEPAGSCVKLQRAEALNCSDPPTRRKCARTCNTCTRLMVPMQVGLLMDGQLPIPDNTSIVMLEIGSSDRNTMDKEMLPQMPEAFLVSAEPLVEKYARALGRRREAGKVQDALEPLGQHNDRGFILPIAVAPVAGNGELRDLNVGGNSGCASLLQPDRARHRRGPGAFGVWCDQTGESDNSKSDSRSGARSVWTVPLSQLLRWIGRPVDFIKIDAQGMDVQIVQSGGDMLRNVRRVLLEVVSDDCKPVYQNQPRCSEVVQRMAGLGFAPLTPLPCHPLMGNRHRVNHYCELEYVFVNQREGINAENTRDEWFGYHQGHFNWCNGTYDIVASGHPHNNMALRSDGATYNALRFEKSNFPMPWFYGSRHDGGARTGKSHPLGQPYLCPSTCFPSRYTSNRTHFQGIEWPSLLQRRMGCPF